MLRSDAAAESAPQPGPKIPAEIPPKTPGRRNPPALPIGGGSPDGAVTSPSSKTGSFSHSFTVHMIRDFFVLLIVVMAVELGIRFALVVYHFDQNEKVNTEVAADQLAADINSIMLNSGGPVAARTLYPILQRRYEALGLSIAIEPSSATVSSIESVFDFKPQGIVTDWPTGKHHESSIQLRAEEFCLTCHIDANVGDVLGTVTVRNYFATHLLGWWEEVRLTATLGMGKVLIHTVVLFFLLKVRMEPLISLRSVIAQLAKAGSDLSHRAEVKTHDEFGELARDLNLFLDRISHIIEDLRTVLTRVSTVNHRLSQTHHQMGERVERLNAGVTKLTREAFEGQDRDPFLSKQWFQSIEVVLSALELSFRDRDIDPELEAKTQRIWEQFRDSARYVQDVQRRHDHMSSGLVDLSRDLQEFSHFMGEMAVLEEKMQAIAEMGQTLVHRLSRVRQETPQ